MSEMRPELRITARAGDGQTAIIIQYGIYEQAERTMIPTTEDGKWYKSGPSR